MVAGGTDHPLAQLRVEQETFPPAQDRGIGLEELVSRYLRVDVAPSRYDALGVWGDVAAAPGQGDDLDVFVQLGFAAQLLREGREHGRR